MKMTKEEADFEPFERTGDNIYESRSGWVIRREPYGGVGEQLWSLYQIVPEDSTDDEAYWNTYPSVPTAMAIAEQLYHDLDD
jgi:hypothetical protein